MLPERAVLLDVFHKALEAVEPEAATGRTLARWQLPSDAVIVAIGKAAAAMARGAAPWFAGIDGVVITDHPEPVPDGLRLFVASHPIPDERSQAAGAAALEMASRSSDMTLFLISGGASALCELAAPGLDLADIVAVNRLLLSVAVPIADVNVVRKHLSSVKGGRLGIASPAPCRLTLAVSDVVGGNVDVIGSGPAVPDPSTYADALAVIRRHGLAEQMPSPIMDHLAAGTTGELPETPSAFEHEAIIIADAAVAAEAAAYHAGSAGIPAEVISTELEGDAAAAAVEAVAHPAPGALSIWAGETTVTVAPGGRGGRNQQAALTGALEIEGSDDVVFAALGTDGRDGPTDAAGALVDGRTCSRGRSRGLDPEDHLRRTDAYPFLDAAGDLVRTGPTGTNVGDLWMVWRRS